MPFAIVRKNVMTDIEAYLTDIVEYNKTDESFSTMHSYTDELESAKKFEVLDEVFRYIKRLINSDKMLRDSLIEKYFNEANKNCFMMNSFDKSKIEKDFNDLLMAFAIENTSTYNRYNVYDCIKGETIFKIADLGERGKGSCIIVTTPPGSKMPSELLIMLQYMMNKEEK